MPAHLVRDELENGSLVRLDTEGFDAVRNSVWLGVATSPDRLLGPAASWMVEHLQTMREGL